MEYGKKYITIGAEVYGIKSVSYTHLDVYKRQIYTVLGILAAFYFQILIDSVLPDGLKKTLMTLSIGVILLNLFRVILNAFRSHLLLYLSQKLDIALLLGYYRHVMELPMNFFGTRKVGEIISRFNDAGKVRDAISYVYKRQM